MFVVNGDPLKAIEVEYNVSVDVLFSSFKHLAAERQRQKDLRRELYDVIATTQGVQLQWGASTPAEIESKKPKSNAEFEMKLSQMGFKIGFK